jgi:hypothetical protein
MALDTNNHFEDPIVPSLTKEPNTSIDPLDTLDFSYDRSLFGSSQHSITSVEDNESLFENVTFELTDTVSVDTAALYAEWSAASKMFSKDTCELSPPTTTNQHHEDNSSTSSQELSEAQQRFYDKSNEFFTIVFHASPTTAPLYPTRSEFIIGNNNEYTDHNDDRMKRLFKALFHDDWKNTYSLSHSEQDPVFLDSLSLSNKKKH